MKALILAILMIATASAQTLTHTFTTPNPNQAQIQDTYLEEFLHQQGAGDYVLKVQAPQQGTFIGNARDYNARHIIRNVSSNGAVTCATGYLEPEDGYPLLRPRFHSFVMFMEGVQCYSQLWKKEARRNEICLAANATKISQSGGNDENGQELTDPYNPAISTP